MFEILEQRTLMSAAPLTINGTSGNDTITVIRKSNTPMVQYKVTINGVSTNYTALNISQITINAGAGNDNVLVDGNIKTPCVIRGAAGNDILTGGGGPDRIYGGAGVDFIHGGEGDDTIVTVGGGIADISYGDDGSDSFWVDSEFSELVGDATNAELNAGQIHRINGFTGFFNTSVSRELNGQTLADPIPTDSSYTIKCFSSKPLFATDGPTKDDIFQGSVGDCYFLSGLSSVAKMNPNRIRQTACDLGDGTYAVDFHTPNGHEFVRMDGDLWTTDGSSLAYAKLGHQDSLWVPIVEKGWAIARRGESTYASISGGNGSGLDWSQALGGSYISWETSIFPTPELYLDMIQSQLQAGHALELGGPADFANSALTGKRRGQHIYMVDKVNYSNGHAVSIDLRDPYGSYITIGAQHLFNRSLGFRSVTL
jgi:hypothetical protein